MYKIILTSTNSMENAKIIANSLVSKKISPCVQLIPQVISIFKWKNKIQNENEILLLIKIVKEHSNLAKSEIINLHNYDNPEIIITNFDILSQKYKLWFNENSK